jgi:hypothetical protein
LYEGLTGSRPFSNRSLPDYMLSVLADEPKDPCELRPGIAPELGRIAMRCLAREPEQRWASAQELAQALQTCPGFDLAASRERLSALLTRHFASERSRDEQLAQSREPAEVSLRRSAAVAPPHGGWRFRALILLLVLAIALSIIAWVGVSRGSVPQEVGVPESSLRPVPTWERVCARLAGSFVAYRLSCRFVICS